MSTMGTAEKQIIQQIEERAKVGFNKYGVTTDRSDLTILEWLQHLKEEQMDSLIYNQVLQNRLSKLRDLCQEYKLIREEKDFGYLSNMEARQEEIFEEAMKLMLGDGIIDYLKCL